MLLPGDAAEVAEAFGLGAPVGSPALEGPVAAGHVGRVHRLTTRQGRFAVKEALGPVSEEQASVDAELQDAALAAGVPLPRVRRTRDGAVLARVGEGVTVRVHDWVDLAPATRRLDPDAVGRLLARLHRVVRPADGPPTAWTNAAVGAAGWSDLVSRLREAGAADAEDLAKLVPAVLAVEELVASDREEPWQLCHGDLWTDNLRQTPDGELVVLDWEECRPGTPARELAVVAYDVGDGEAERVTALCRAYANAGGPGRLREPADCATLVFQLGHIVQAGGREWLECAAAGDEAGSAAAEAWVREFLDDPVTPATIGWLLAAAALSPESRPRT